MSMEVEGNVVYYFYTDHAKPNVIKINLKHADVFGRDMPTKVQLYNKIAETKQSFLHPLSETPMNSA